jgi:phospholipase C
MGETDKTVGRLLDRRRFLEVSLATSAAALLAATGRSTLASADTVRRAASVAPRGSDLGAVEHVIFFMQENRSFDHYYGTLRGVRGFDDHPAHHLGAFAQADPANTTRHPTGVQLPFHLDTRSTDTAACTYDLTHEWVPQHRCRADGTNAAFVSTHTESQYEGPQHGLTTMGYYTRADLPYYYALADAFTICDNYHCSVMGPTHPNRLMSLSGTIDPTGKAGGPVLFTNPLPEAVFSVHWDTVPEVLEDAGVSWKVYNTPGQGFTIPAFQKYGILSDAILPYFAQYQKPSSALYQKAFTPTYPDDFVADIKSGNLPAVSWIIPPPGYDEHPPSPSALGEWLTDQILGALVANPEVWSKTVLFHMYDENDGWFDHVPPPVPPAGAPGEWLRQPLPAAAHGVDGPVGLGFRVPMLVLSPFSRGGYVATETFDHTSQLRFLEERFGIRAPNLSAWRRRTVGDLTSTLRLSKADASLPTLPATSGDTPAGVMAQGCTTGDIYEISNDQPPYPQPAVQRMPTQEPGDRAVRAGRG